MPAPLAAPLAAKASAGKSGGVGAWVKGHPGEAAGLGAGGALVLYLLAKSRSSAAAAANTSSSSSTAAENAALESAVSALDAGAPGTYTTGTGAGGASAYNSAGTLQSFEQWFEDTYPPGSMDTGGGSATSSSTSSGSTSSGNPSPSGETSSSSTPATGSTPAAQPSVSPIGSTSFSYKGSSYTSTGGSFTLGNTTYYGVSSADAAKLVKAGAKLVHNPSDPSGKGLFYAVSK